MTTRDDRVPLQILVPTNGGVRGGLLVLPPGASRPEGLQVSNLVVVQVEQAETTYQVGQGTPSRLLSGRSQDVLGFGLIASEPVAFQVFPAEVKRSSPPSLSNRREPEGETPGKRPLPNLRISLVGGGSMTYILPSVPGTVIVIGRARKSCDICIDDVRIAKKHMRLEWRGTSYSVIDTSGFGTAQINGESFVWPAMLKDGDVIEIGAARMQFRLNSPDSGAIAVTPGARSPGPSIRERLWDWCPRVPRPSPRMFLILGGIIVTGVVAGLAFLVMR